MSGDNGGYGDTRLIYEPGTKWSYSGGGYSILQLLAEEVTGKTFTKYMNSDVLPVLRQEPGSPTLVPEAPMAAAGGVFNIGSGGDHTIFEVARRLAAAMGRPRLAPELIGKARTGDVRHCFADISLARQELGYRPARHLEDGLGELTDWVQTQHAIDRVSEARLELEKRGLVA